MHDLTAFQRDLLVVIAGMDQPHGLAVKSEVDDYYEADIYHGRLYPNLDTLVEKGLVNKDRRDDRTNEYMVTSRGRREIEYRREWVDSYAETVTQTSS